MYLPLFFTPPATNMPITMLCLTATCGAFGLTIVRRSGDVAWNETLETPVLEDSGEVLYVTSNSVPSSCSTVVRRGSLVGIRYKGWIAQDSAGGTPGAVFARASNTTIHLMVGAGEAILGMELGLVGLCAAETVRAMLLPHSPCSAPIPVARFARRLRWTSLPHWPLVSMATGRAYRRMRQ